MIAMLITAFHLSCLSMIESGNDDYAVGKDGEISAYQIKASIWRDKAGGLDPHDLRTATGIAAEIWQGRVNHFVDKHKREPSDEEAYLLWNCPSHVDSPHKVEWDKAVRFKNLMHRQDAKT